MNKQITLLLPLVLLMAVIVPSVSGTTDNFTSTDDSYVDEGVPNGNFGGANTLTVTSFGALDKRSYVKFYLDSLGDDQVLNATLYLYCYYTESLSPPDTDIQVRESANNWDETNITWNNAPVLGAVIDTQSAVDETWVAWDVTSYVNAKYAGGDRTVSLGLRMVTESAPAGNITWYRPHENASFAPRLWVDYSNYTYHFTDTYYENGTLAVDPFNVSISVSGTGISDSYNTSGGADMYYESEPDVFFWDIGGGVARNIYSFGSENFTTTIPDDTDYVYSFTVKDYTGKLGLGQGYLEAWRIINGSETLIERMPIIQPNAVPLNLVYGKTYHLYILFADGTRYDWGYFVAAGTSELTLVLRTITFSDQIQPLYGTIFVEATRNTAGTTLTVDYNDTRENTVWANVSISLRGGGVVNTATRNNDSYTYNWAGANASLGYIVTVSGDHSDFGEWGYVKIFDEAETFPDAPDLTGIFDFGLGANFGAWLLTTATVIGFSKAWQSRSIIAGMVMATLLRYIGWATWDYNFIMVGWLFTIAVTLTIGGSE